MATRKNYDEVKARIAELLAKVKAKTATPEETIDLAEAREALRRHEAAERIKTAKAKMKEGKREALLHILDENRIDTENKLKAILRYAQDTKPELIPGKPKSKESEKNQ